jgi:hypothetical protein
MEWYEYIKVTASRDFRYFFRQTIRLGPLFHGLKRFQIWVHIREDIKLEIILLRAMRHNAELGF